MLAAFHMSAKWLQRDSMPRWSGGRHSTCVQGIAQGQHAHGVQTSTAITCVDLNLPHNDWGILRHDNTQGGTWGFWCGLPTLPGLQATSHYTRWFDLGLPRDGLLPEYHNVPPIAFPRICCSKGSDTCNETKSANFFAGSLDCTTTAQHRRVVELLIPLLLSCSKVAW